jgi:low temperature requirement protein LtrA
MSVSKKPAFWWQTPQLRTEEDEHIHRKVSWLELFYDLVFVVAIAEAAHLLVEHPDAGGVGRVAFAFVPVWLMWNASTYYNERFETEGLESRLIVFAKMVIVGTLAIFTHDAMDKGFVGFVGAYLAGRILLTMLWARAGRHNMAFRPVARRFVAGFSGGIALMAASLFAPPPLHFVLFSSGLLLDLLTPSLTVKQQRTLPQFSTSKLPERFGLFTIIVLGETIVGVLQGLAGLQRWPLEIGASGLAGLAIGFGIWWIYFDFVARRAPRPDTGSTLIWTYTHLPLAMGIAVSGAGLRALFNTIEAGQSTREPQLILGGAIGLVLFAIAGIEATLRSTPDEPTHLGISSGLKVVVGMGILALCIFTSSWTPLWFLACLVALMAIPMVYGVIVWFRR